MSKGSQPAGNTTSTQAPAPYMLPYIGTAFGQANKLLASSGPKYYPGNTVAGFTAPQQQAMGKIDQLALKGTPQERAAGDLYDELMQGGGSNPWLDQTFKQAAGATQDQLASEFAGAGRNVEASQPLRAEQLNNLATQIYGGNYQATLNDALAAAQGGQALTQQRYGDLGQMLGVGGMVQGQAQKLMDANKSLYDYYQQLPYRQLQQYEQFLQDVQPGSQSTTPYFNNPGANLLETGQGLMNLYNGGKQAGWWGGGGGQDTGFYDINGSGIHI